MQPYYGDEPHIIQKRPKKRRVYGKKRRGTLRIFLIFAFCAILPIAAVCAFMPKIAQPTTKTYRSKAYAIYFLITGSYDAIADANLASDVVRERGGAGYIINDGSFKVVAAVYKTKKTAEAVAAKQKIDATVYELTVKEAPLGSDKDAAKRLMTALNACDSAYADITAVTEDCETGNATESALSLAVTNAANGLKDAAGGISDIEVSSPIIEYLEASADGLAGTVTDEKHTLTVRVRYALCSLMYERYLLSSKLAKTNQ